MATKSLKEMAANLKQTLIDLAERDTKGAAAANMNRYNNLKLSMRMEQETELIPHIIINMTISEATFSLKDCEKLGGSLGMDEKYVLRWFGKPLVLECLREIWNDKLNAERKSKDSEEDDAV